MPYRNSNKFRHRRQLLLAEKPKIVAGVFPLDLIETAAYAAYATVGLRQAYADDMFRVRSDDTGNPEQNIGLVGDAMDITAVTDFVGANSGFVRRWDDMSGNNRDANQTTALQQPRIVNAGTFSYMPDGETPGFDWFDADSRIDSPAAAALFDNPGWTVFMVFVIHSRGGGAQGRWFDKTRNRFQVSGLSGSSVSLRFIQVFDGDDGDWSSAAPDEFPITFGTRYSVAVRYNNNATTNDPDIFVNGSGIAITETTAPTGTREDSTAFPLIIGNSSANTRNMDGEYEAFIVFNSLLSDADILTLHNGFFG